MTEKLNGEYKQPVKVSLEDYLEKALRYQSINTLQAYLIVSQDKPQVDMLVHSEDGSWALILPVIVA